MAVLSWPASFLTSCLPSDLFLALFCIPQKNVRPPKSSSWHQTANLPNCKLNRPLFITRCLTCVTARVLSTLGSCCHKDQPGPCCALSQQTEAAREHFSHLIALHCLRSRPVSWEVKGRLLAEMRVRGSKLVFFFRACVKNFLIEKKKTYIFFFTKKK